MKIRAIIQARMGSTRLRAKSLMPVNGIPLLLRVVEAVKKYKFLNEIMVATTDRQEDDPIVSLCTTLGLKVFRGSPNHVLERFVKASSDMEEDDCIVRFTADNPFSWAAVSAKEMKIHIDGAYDYTHIDGLSHIAAEFIRVSALRKAYNQPDLDGFDIEHVTPYLRKHKNMFRVKTLPPDFEGLRHDLDKYLTIDTSEDLYRLEDMIKALRIDLKPEVDFEEIFEWLEHKVNPKSSYSAKASNSVNLAGTHIGDGYPTYIIAEIGQNHNGDMHIAKKLIEMAARCGANGVKFQKRDMGCELTSDAFNKLYDNPNSFGRTYGEHRLFLELDESQHLELKEYASACGLTYFCTPCDIPSVELLERLDCPFYKIASRDLTNLPLLKRLSETGKPVIFSTGMADYGDIEDALKILNYPKDKLIIMQCTSEYPCRLENVNLRVINTLKDKYGYQVGLSDHTSGIIVAVAASVMGANIVEKHITLDRTMKGTDHAGSLEESGLKKLVEYIRAIELAMGSSEKNVLPVTKSAKEKLSRSVTSKTFIAKGTLLTEDMICLKSPGTGYKWRQRELLLNKIAKLDIQPDVTLGAEMFE